ncbi:putative quorum-sensing-regulated virulence factor [Planctomicrobium sp. SH668]|uniref:putative quorum-sensing-regulated virulence factor n=1 Tax=Planctomicrobium sp. SH668 TaxID=3448126 RepID=UPI003F5AF490
MDPKEAKIIEDRVAAGKLAKQIVEMVQTDLPHDPAARRFIEVLQAELIPPQEVLEVTEPLGRLGAYGMPFGKYRGMPLEEIPLIYLDWIVSTQEDSLRHIKAYLAHPKVKADLAGQLEVSDALHQREVPM